MKMHDSDIKQILHNGSNPNIIVTSNNHGSSTKSSFSVSSTYHHYPSPTSPSNHQYSSSCSDVSERIEPIRGSTVRRETDYENMTSTSLRHPDHPQNIDAGQSPRYEESLLDEDEDGDISALERLCFAPLTATTATAAETATNKTSSTTLLAHPSWESRSVLHGRQTSENTSRLSTNDQISQRLNWYSDGVCPPASSSATPTPPPHPTARPSRLDWAEPTNIFRSNATEFHSSGFIPFHAAAFPSSSSTGYHSTPSSLQHTARNSPHHGSANMSPVQATVHTALHHAATLLPFSHQTMRHCTALNPNTRIFPAAAADVTSYELINCYPHIARASSSSSYQVHRNYCSPEAPDERAVPGRGQMSGCTVTDYSIGSRAAVTAPVKTEPRGGNVVNAVTETISRSTGVSTLPLQSTQKTTAATSRFTASTSTGKTRTKDKYRTVYSEPQKAELEKQYLHSTYISAQRKADISRLVQLSERQVKIWFQNRRAKDRKYRRKHADRLQRAQGGHGTTLLPGSMDYGRRGIGMGAGVSAGVGVRAPCVVASSSGQFELHRTSTSGSSRCTIIGNCVQRQ